MGHLSAYIVLSQKTSAISKKRIRRMYFVRGCLPHGWTGLLIVNVRHSKDSYRRVSYKGGEQHTVSNMEREMRSTERDMSSCRQMQI